MVNKNFSHPPQFKFSLSGQSCISKLRAQCLKANRSVALPDTTGSCGERRQPLGSSRRGDWVLTWLHQKAEESFPTDRGRSESWFPGRVSSKKQDGGRRGVVVVDVDVDGVVVTAKAIKMLPPQREEEDEEEKQRRAFCAMLNTTAGANLLRQEVLLLIPLESTSKRCSQAIRRRLFRGRSVCR